MDRSTEAPLAMNMSGELVVMVTVGQILGNFCWTSLLGCLFYS